MEQCSREKKLKSLIIGATGATGRELVDLLISNDLYSNVTVLVRRKIERWNNMKEEASEKLRIILTEDLTVLSQDNEKIMELFENKIDFDTVFCCLGSRTKLGDEFTRVDYDYVVYSAQFCEKYKIPHFSLISSKGANASSWFLYLRVKGRADNECLKKNIPYISILRPGVILNRDNDSRFGEKCLSYIPFIDKIQTVDLAQAIMIDDLKYHFKNEINKEKTSKIFVHSEINSLKNTKL